MLPLTLVNVGAVATVNPLNVTLSVDDNCKFVLAAAAVVAPVPPFAKPNVPDTFEKLVFNLLLNVVKSDEPKYPFAVAVATGISIVGVVVPVNTTIGLPAVAAADTFVTVPVEAVVQDNMPVALVDKT